MRLWSLHPCILDRKGLLACWRESLLAQAVLLELTKGYKNHPQLTRFKNADDQYDAIGAYLEILYAEATGRGYKFNANKILRRPANMPEIPGTLTQNFPTEITPGAPWLSLPVTRGQILYERHHLLNKLEIRDPLVAKKLADTPVEDTPIHSLFTVIEGDIEPWERVSALSAKQ